VEEAHLADDGWRDLFHCPILFQIDINLLRHFILDLPLTSLLPPQTAEGKQETQQDQHAKDNPYNGTHAQLALLILATIGLHHIGVSYCGRERPDGPLDDASVRGCRLRMTSQRSRLRTRTPTYTPDRTG
jgi:hypothetical protein